MYNRIATPDDAPLLDTLMLNWVTQALRYKAPRTWPRRVQGLQPC